MEEGERKAAPAHSLGPTTALAIIVNACMGMGFLSLPYTSVRLGPTVAMVVTLLLGGMALLTALWTAVCLSLTAALGRPGGDPEVMARAPARQEHVPEDRFSLDSFVFAAYSEMLRALFGDAVWRLASLCLALALAVVMWAYAALVSSTLTSMVPLPFLGGPCDAYSAESAHCRAVYGAYLAAFAVLVTALSACSFREQRGFQVSMTSLRLLLVCCILGDCLRMKLLDEAPPPPGAIKGHATHGGEVAYDPHRFPEIPAFSEFQPHSLLQHVAVAMAALTVHMIIPEAVEELAEKPKNLLPTVGGAMAFCILVYILVSAAVAFTFGHWTLPVCTLNWAHNTFGEPTAGYGALAFRAFLLLVPTLDVTGAYPVLASSLAGTLRLFVGTETTWRLKAGCALLPSLGAALVKDLPRLLGVVGLLMLVFVFVLPPLLLMSAEDRCVKAFGEEALRGSPYWRWHCDRRIARAVLVLGVATTLAAAPVVSGMDKILF